MRLVRSPNPRLRLLAAPAALVMLLLLAPTPTQAHGAEHVEWTIRVRDDSCLGGAPYCFDIVEGTRDPVDGGLEAELTLRNDGETTHHFFVTTIEKADRGRSNTIPNGPLAAGDPMGAEGQELLAFTIPRSTEALYLWCDRPGHELAGMWLKMDVTPQPEEQDSPGIGALAVLGGLAVLALARRR